VRVWARPSGWEGLTTLDAREDDFDQAPAVGDLLWIWTWDDVWKEQGREHKEPGICVQVERRELTDDARARLRALLAELKESEP
jgi:hypothetical protein